MIIIDVEVVGVILSLILLVLMLVTVMLGIMTIWWLANEVTSITGKDIPWFIHAYIIITVVYATIVIVASILKIVEEEE